MISGRVPAPEIASELYDVIEGMSADVDFGQSWTTVHAEEGQPLKGLKKVAFPPKHTSPELKASTTVSPARETP